MSREPTESPNHPSKSATRHPLFTTWALWRQLMYPPAHPLFERAHTTSSSLPTKPRTLWILPLIALGIGCGCWLLTTQVTSSPVLLLFIVLALFSSTFYVTVWISGISTSIAREYEHHTYDLLCMPPSGPLGANWAICTAILHRDDTFIWLDRFRKVMTGLILIIFLLVQVTAASRQVTFDGLEFVRLLLDTLVLIAASYLDHVQSIVSGSLIAMFIPHHFPTRQDARLVSVTFFLTMQASSFAIGILTLSVMNQLLAFPGVASLFSLLVFYLIREGFIAVIWRALTYQLNTNPENPLA